MGKRRDLTNQRFGKLVGIKPIGKTSDHRVIWLWQCDCGNIKEYFDKSLLRIQSEIK